MKFKSLCTLLNLLTLPTICNCFIMSEELATIAYPFQGTRFHDTITKAAVCKVQFDWLARNGNINGIISPNPFAYEPCDYFRWGFVLDRTFLLAEIALQGFAKNSFKPDFDPSTKNNPLYHFDSDIMINETNTRLIAARLSILNRFEDVFPDYIRLRAKIGYSLHTIQDFYSHTNWIEMNQTKPNKNISLDNDLGIPIAPANMSTCSNCSRENLTPSQLQEANDYQNSLASGFFAMLGYKFNASNVYICKDNILNTGYLTSGYSSSEDFVAPKIASKMKCSHGGGMDSSVHIAATGGINKDANSFLYAPHFDLHYNAADVAVQATIDYLEGIRSAVSNEVKFGRLLGLIL